MSKSARRVAPSDAWFTKRFELWEEIAKALRDDPTLTYRMVWSYLAEEHDYPYTIHTVERKFHGIPRGM